VHLSHPLYSSTLRYLRRHTKEKEEKATEEEMAKARWAALQGKVGFVKLVWKEMKVLYDYFA